MIKTECNNCIHDDVCALKSIVNETDKQLNESKIGCKHPDIEVVIKCRKFRNDTPIVR